MDSRDGGRQGLPWEAAMDLLFLAELSIAKRALVASAVTGLPFPQMLQSCREQAGRPESDLWAHSVPRPKPDRTEREQASRPSAARTLKTQLAHST